MKYEWMNEWIATDICRRSAALLCYADKRGVIKQTTIADYKRSSC